MKTEELLKPRWKVIDTYPFSKYQIGEIVISDNNANILLINNGHIFPDNYPAIFKKLEWWEEREEKDLPEYVKYKNNTILKISRHPIHPKYYWDQSKLIHLGECMPATEQEYLSQ